MNATAAFDMRSIGDLGATVGEVLGVTTEGLSGTSFAKELGW